ncbi:Undecaprenyl diphosphate synthase [Teratosphaeria nubilosa]|uniref:ditrans,polycis-polyprenyl diphosphate synthase [(2E,6E)-farnesyldiphosphate specific] n=1 Tax=Teratosphaeria nubilosa TaxID=161662 RepID=A0A6G1KUI7_9PEZI|nr:Undecaprenyl diphosphate synthase [Teratosphaeria nubilosa]
MVGIRQQAAFHSDRDASGRPLSPEERERMLQPYLPPQPEKRQPAAPVNAMSPKHMQRFHRKRRLRPAIRHLLHYALFTLIHLVFGVYIRARQTYHAIVDQIFAVYFYHHRTPELIRRDVKGLGKLPKHLSVILDLQPEGGKKDRLEALVNDACEVAAWCAGAGIPMLSIYERTGMLKSSLPHLHRRICRNMDSYFGHNNPNKPSISVRAPHQSSYSPPHSPQPQTNGTTPTRPHLTILLISAEDGRQTLVDLTRTLASMAQENKLSPSDISSELIDVEISESVMGEPDLLVLFGERLVLDGYPPWQVRLTEIYGVQDYGGGVGYSVFLRALYKFARAEMRFGS